MCDHTSDDRGGARKPVPGPRAPVHAGGPARQSGFRTDEGGFTFVEVVAAIGIFSLVSLFMAAVMAGGMRGVMLGKQRSVATADANQLLETARSLSYADVGLASNDATLDTDPAIATVSPTNRTYQSEPIVFARSTQSHPFSPHVQAVSRTPVSLTRAIYVTGVDTNADGVPDVKRVTVVVSWARSPIAGVASSVAASTLISVNSPGTPGNPPLPGTCTGAACPTPTPPPFPPLVSSTTVRASDGLVEAAIGSNSELDGGGTPPVAQGRFYGVNGQGSHVLDARSVLACSQQYGRLEGALAGAPFGSTSGTKAAASADSVSNPGPNSASRNQAEITTNVLPAPLTVASASLVGGVQCDASGVTTASTLPSESGTGSFAALVVASDTSSAPLDAVLGTFNLLELSGLTANHSAAQSVPSNKVMTSTATHGMGDLKVMRQTALTSGVIDLGASEGLVRVTTYQATATSTASTSAGTAGVTQDPTKPLTIKIWNNGNPASVTNPAGVPVTCDSQTAGYCVISPGVNDARVIRSTQTMCKGLVPLVCLVSVTVDITVTVNPARTESLTLADQITKVYRTDYAPVTIVARVYASNNGSSSKGFDLRTTVDAGRLVTCSKYGVFPGGC